MPTATRPDPAAGRSRARVKAALLTWIAIYPTVTLVLAAFGALGLTDLALPLRTLALTVLVVPIAMFVLVPWLRRLLGRWLAG